MFCTVVTLSARDLTSCTTHNDINTNPFVCHNDNGPDQLITLEVTEVQRVNPEVIAHADAMQSNNTHQF